MKLQYVVLDSCPKFTTSIGRKIDVVTRVVERAQKHNFGSAQPGTGQRVSTSKCQYVATAVRSFREAAGRKTPAKRGATKKTVTAMICDAVRDMQHVFHLQHHGHVP